MFTKHLLAALQVPGLGVRNLFARVREAVSAESTAVWQKPQTPGLSDELIGEFVFRPAGDPSEDELAESRLAAALGRESSAFHSDGNGWTDLHYAAALNLPGLARDLLDAGAPVDARMYVDDEPWDAELSETLERIGRRGFAGWTRVGYTPLHIAAAINARAVVTVLAGRGADLEVRVNGHTPLHLASLNGNWGIVTELLGRGADIEATRTPNGWNSLHDASYGGRRGVVTELLGRGADIEAKTDQRRARGSPVDAYAMPLRRRSK